MDDTDITGLTHLGAREYDPETGRFLSVDPVMDPSDPQQMQGYAYGNSNPVTNVDPDGRQVLMPDGLGHGVSNGKISGWPPPGRSGAGGGSSYSTYEQARTAMWSRGPTGTQFTKFNIGKGENRGIIMVRYFIHTYDAMRVVPGTALLLGDNRSFSLAPDTDAYRMVLFWDTASGDVTFKVSPSHTPPRDTEISSYAQGGGRAPIPVHVPSKMLPANPLYLNMASWKTILGRNILNDNGSDSDALRVSVHGVQPVASVGAVDNSLEISATQHSVGVARSGNAYPDFEVVQYRDAWSVKSIARDEMANEDGYDAVDGFPGRQLINNRKWIDGKCVRSC
ncbi:RHS repeat-associated core domain-containing protein [Streptomyces sp. NPDC048483]|uniref:RHS repeat-associated core domain-containing protein n=1 Tax=Streptomyces sp. NPDC048483 TaxID=3154927 RepID=UPI00343791DB